MRIYGLDFTSAPGRRKPLIALECSLEDAVLRVEGAEEMTDFAGFERFLAGPGPWVCGIDFPFGQPRSLVSALGWPLAWQDYVGHVAAISKEEFEAALRADMALRPAGSKYRYRLADRRSNSSSAMMLFRVPVGKMFYQGAPRLLAAGVSVEPCRKKEDARVAIEAYPAIVARRFIARASYKNDERRKQTAAQAAAREALVAGLRSGALKEVYGFAVDIGRSLEKELVGDPAAEALDSLLCAVQAAWAHGRRDENYGVPPECDPNEGWILDPVLLANGRS